MSIMMSFPASYIPRRKWLGSAVEEELKEAGTAYVVGKFPFMANGRAGVNGTTDGFGQCWLMQDRPRLGVHILGAQAGDMIAEAAVAMGFQPARKILRAPATPATLTEAVKETALAVDNRALHMWGINFAHPTNSGC